MANLKNLASPYLERHAEALIQVALSDTRIVMLVGPRQTGKTTLAQKIADEEDRAFISLDEPDNREYAREDPIGLLRNLDRAVIDEVQFAPDLILALKREVDVNPEPGRISITGSVDLVRGRYAPDSLAGRTETVTLLPLSRSELDGLNPSTFLNQTVESQFSNDDFIGITDDTIGRILRGGNPLAANRDSQRRRKECLSNYVNSLMTRDVPDFTGIRKSNALRQLVAHLASNSAQSVNLSRLATEIGVDGKSINRWLTTLEDMFLISRLPAWNRSDAKRLVKTPKLHFLDTGLLCALRNID